MPRYGMLIDTTKCVQCFACVVACQNQNQLPAKETYIRFEDKEEGQFPNVRWATFPIQCHHCDNAPCASVCPTKARATRPDGVVLVDQKRCIGCKYCVAVCPYQANTQSEKHGHIEKCRFCIEEVEKGGKPACLATCLTNCRTFGDLDDQNSEISKKILATRAVKLRPDLGTKSKIYYVV